MPGKKQFKGNYFRKVNNLDIYQRIEKPLFSKNYKGEVTKTKEGSSSFDIYRGRNKIKEFGKLEPTIKFCEGYVFEMTKKKQRKLKLIK